MKYILMTSSMVVALVVGVNSAYAGYSGPSETPPRALVLEVSSEAAAKGAEAFIDRLAQDGIGFLSDVSMSDDGRKGEFRKLLNKNFDLNTIARFTLGRNWKSLSDAQRKEYLSSFKRMIVEVYSRRFSDYQGQKLEVRGSRPEGTSDVLVKTAIVPPSGPEVAVDWRVRKSSGEYKVVDVIVEGVSMAVTQRADFSSVIQRGGGDVNALLVHLRQ
jgi:phospholipid transport system substrate-binding protein